MIIMTDKRVLRANGEADYDYESDILFFKIKNREYETSLDMGRFSVDFDNEKFVVGIQIFDASEFFGVSKILLRSIKKWGLQIDVAENKLEIRLMFQIVSRNKVIEKNPIIIESLRTQVPDSKVMCAVK